MATNATQSDLQTLLDEDPMGRAAQDLASQQRISTPEERATWRHASRALGEQGYAVLPGMIEADALEEIRREMDVAHRTVPLGRNAFAGTLSQRIFNILAKMPCAHALAMDPRVIAIVEDHLDDPIQLSTTASNSILPGQPAQQLHQDDSYYRVQRPHPPLSVTVAWLIDDFTLENGATILMPGSHKLPDTEQPDLPLARAVAPAGSLVMWDGAMWHGAGANQSDAIRRGILFTYVRGWLRQQENLYLSLSPDMIRAMPRTLQRLCGWWVVAGLLGVVEAEYPLKLLK